jgi:hypothetical protein
VPRRVYSNVLLLAALLVAVGAGASPTGVASLDRKWEAFVP